MHPHSLSTLRIGSIRWVGGCGRVCCWPTALLRAATWLLSPRPRCLAPSCLPQPSPSRTSGTAPTNHPAPVRIKPTHQVLERLLLLLTNLDSGPGADRADAMHGKASLLPKSSTALSKVRACHRLGVAARVDLMHWGGWWGSWCMDRWI